METTFSIKKYGRETILKIGQKVECSYYHEYPRKYMDRSYHRPLYQLIDPPFKPVKLGIIVGDAGFHPYWLAHGDNEQYLFVKFKEYIFNKAIPISCIQDASESAAEMERFLKESESKIGEFGYDLESYNALTEQMNKAKKFTI